jgi:heme-degrading monooxygenase HmoA
VIVREFVVAEGKEQEFLQEFGPDGSWPALLMTVDGYRGSESFLWSAAERRYRVFDRWSSHRAFEGFRRQRQQEYESFMQRMLADGLIEKELVLGSFYESDSDSDDPGFEDGTGLVPA